MISSEQKRPDIPASEPVSGGIDSIQNRGDTTLLQQGSDDHPNVKSTSDPLIAEHAVKTEYSKSMPDSGTVFFTCTPWAKVYVDNELAGITPIEKPFILASGEHTVTFTNPSFDPLVQTIRVIGNRDMTVTGNFIRHAGYVRCVVTPWADIYVDEQYRNQTPLSTPIVLSEGKHTIRFKNSSFPDIVRRVTITAQDTISLTISFTK